MGPLHIEQTAMVCLGQLIKGTKIVQVMNLAELSITGLTTAVCDVNSIKKARYSLQVLAVCLSRLLQEAYKNDADVPTLMSYNEWIKQQEST